MRFGAYPDFPCIASLLITPVQSQSDDRLDERDITESQTIHLGIFKPNPVWAQMDKYVSAAKRRPRRKPLDQYPVFIDFGQLTSSESPPDNDMASIKEKSVRGALSLDSGESQLWSEFFS